MEYSVLNGTGVRGDHMVFSAHCLTGCRSWPGGYMDISSDHQGASYALGPREDFSSNDPAAPIKFHSEFGSFEINMKRTLGHADSPALTDDSKNAGTTPHGSKSGMVNPTSTAHAVFMVLVFVVVLPIAAVLPRFADAVKSHAIMQSLSLLGGLVGFGLGVKTSFHYQRVSSATLDLVETGVLTYVVSWVHLGPPDHRDHRDGRPDRPIVRISQNPSCPRCTLTFSVSLAFCIT